MPTALLLGSAFDLLPISYRVNNHHDAFTLLKSWSEGFFPQDATLFLNGAGMFVPGTGTGSVTSVTVSSGTLTITGSPITTVGDISVDLTNTGVTAGSYTNTNLTVDAYGRITAASDGTSGPGTITITGDAGGSGTGTIPLTLNTVNSNVGTFNNVTVNGKGLVTSATNVAYITGNQTITLTGATTGSGTTSITTSLTPTGVVAGTYTWMNATVNAAGQLTSATSNVAPVTSVGLADGSATPIYNITGSPVNNTGTLTFSLKSQAGNLVFASPDGMDGFPSFRALTINDMPPGIVTGILPGPGIGVTNVGDTYTISNTGVLSIIAGTNITISPGSGVGNVTINAATATAVSVGTVLAVTPASQSTAGIIQYVYNFVQDPGTGGVANEAIILPVGVVGQILYVQSLSSWNVFVYPPSGWQINGYGLNQPINLPSSNSGLGELITFICTAVGEWVSSLPIYNTAITQQSGPGISYAYTSSGYLIINSGVLSFNGRNEAVSLTSGDVTTALGYTPVQTVSGTAGEITSTGGSNPVLNLATTTVAAGSYTNTSLTVDAYGRITAASSGSSGAVTSFQTSLSGLTPSTATSGIVTLAGTLGILSGGTGQTTAAAAYNVLSPMSTTGDIEFETSTGTAARLPIGSTGQVLTVVSGKPAWAAAAVNGNIYQLQTVSTAGSVTIGSSSTAPIITLILNGSSVTSYTVTMPATPFDGQIVIIKVNANGIGTFTINANSGQTMSASNPTTVLSPPIVVTLIYDGINNHWY